MMSPILVKDDTIAFSRLLYSFGEVAVEWPHDAGWTPYGYFIPVNNNSANILDFLEFGPHSPYAGASVDRYGENRVHAFMIDALGRVFHLDMDRVKTPEGGTTMLLYKHRVMSGSGAVYAFSDTVLEHEKAMMSMRLSPTLEEALPIYLDNTLMFQHQYEVYDIPAIAQELGEMGFTLPIP